jgi:hypothetical protein
MRLSSAIVLSCTAGTLVLGCARHRGDPVDQELPRAPVTLEVTNNNWADMVVYVVRSTQRVRVLTVVTSNTASIVLRPDLVGPGGEIRIFAHGIGGGGRYLSPTVFAYPGGTVVVSLETDLARSHVSTW